MPAARDFVGELLGLHAAGQFAHMERMARASMRSYPGAAILHELLGMALSGQLRHAEALDQLRRAVRVEPNDAQFWENLGLCQRQLEDFDRSEASLRRSLALRPDSVETLNALGSVLRALRRYDEAAEALRQALAFDPNHFGARFNLAGTLLESGHLRDAETLIRQVIASKPSFPQAYACLGAILFETGRYDQCAEAARAILDIAGSVDELSDSNVELLEFGCKLACRPRQGRCRRTNLSRNAGLSPSREMASRNDGGRAPRLRLGPCGSRRGAMPRRCAKAMANRPRLDISAAPGRQHWPSGAGVGCTQLRATICRKVLLDAGARARRP